MSATADLAAVRRLIERIDAIPDGLEFTSKADVRQGGFSLHVKFDHKVDVMVSMDIMQMMSDSLPALDALARTCERLLAVEVTA